MVLSASLILATVLVLVQNPSEERLIGVIPVFKDFIPFGVKITVPLNPSRQVNWGDVTVQLSDGTSTSTWYNVTTDDLTSSEKNATWHYGSAKSLGSLSVWLNITDIVGDGRLDAGDYLTFTTTSAALFASDTYYTMTLLYEPTSGSMMSVSFTG